jgi:hypothetical protein
MAKLPTSFTDLTALDQSQYGMVMFNTKTGLPVLVPLTQITSSTGGSGGDDDSLMLSSMQGMLVGYRMSSVLDMFQRYDLTITGAVPFAEGFNGNAASFSDDGANYMTADNAWLPTGARSVSVMVKIPSIPAAADAYVVTCYGSADVTLAFYIFINDDGKVVVSQYGDSYVSDTVLEADTWYHIVVTVTAPSGGNSTYITYIDGVEDATDSMATATNIGANPLFIGKGLGANESPYNGLIDELYFWNRVLSAEEIADLYDALAEGQSPPFFV